MNQDFALVLTPAVARRLMHLRSRYGLIELPDEVTSLAEQDRIQPERFDDIVCPYTLERGTISQFMLDNDMRAIVQAFYHYCMDETSILNCARLHHTEKVSVLTQRASAWRRAANSLFMKIEVRSPYGLTVEWIDAKRDGVLIIDIGESPEFRLSRALSREFPHIILYQTSSILHDNLYDWRLLAASLFPTMPHPLFTMKTRPILDLALFYNICIFPEFITSKMVLSHLRTISRS